MFGEEALPKSDHVLVQFSVTDSYAISAATTDYPTGTSLSNVLGTPPTHTGVWTCGFDMVPIELLIDIFTNCSINDPVAPIKLSCVCRQWRDVVFTSPRVWQLISVDSRRSTVFCRNQARLWLTRSDPLPFDVDVTLESEDMLLPLLSPFLRNVGRWRDYFVSGKKTESARISNLFPPGLFPLSNLTVETHGSDLDDDDDDDEHSAPMITFHTCASSWAQHLSMHVSLGTLPSSHLMSPMRFTTLTISESSGKNTDPAQVLDFLAAFPELEHFRFHGLPHDEGFENVLPFIVSLPRLRCLHLTSTCSARVILSHIYAPALKELYLEHLNVDFDVQGMHGEEGDSDDEAHDFSQSPWSDHAIGMGLRNLIKRSNPPLEILEMDYSDMRTKDFIWCFERLKHLEEFHIAASDMSDKVIELLKPYETIDECGVLNVDVRLPRLQGLRLYNCQRLSGDAIVNTLAARALYTDSATLENTLQDVAVINCDGFSARDAYNLSRVLGDRLRTTT